MQINYRLVLYFFLTVLLIYVLVFKIINFSLKQYTLHAEIVNVPSLIGLSMYEVEDTLLSYDLNFLIIDSAAYNPKFQRGAVLSHDPSYGSIVKPGRKIYLTINPLTIQYLPFPDIQDKSIRQSKRLIENSSFQVGNIHYIDHYIKDVAIYANYNNRKLAHHDSLPKFSIVDLYLGNGFENHLVMPNIINMELSQLKTFLHNSSLNMGLCSLSQPVNDSIFSRVYKQDPPFNSKVPLGTFVNVLAKDTVIEILK